MTFRKDIHYYDVNVMVTATFPQLDEILIYKSTTKINHHTDKNVVTGNIIWITAPERTSTIYTRDCQPSNFSPHPINEGLTN